MSIRTTINHYPATLQSTAIVNIMSMRMCR